MIHVKILWYVAVGGLLLITAGCVEQSANTSASKMSQADIMKYLLSCPKGRPVADIEADLGLPDPTAREGPVGDWDHWTMKYFTGDLVVIFLADATRDVVYEEELAYFGKPDVCTAEEYWQPIPDVPPADSETE